MYLYVLKMNEMACPTLSNNVDFGVATFRFAWGRARHCRMRWTQTEPITLNQTHALCLSIPALRLAHADTGADNETPADFSGKAQRPFQALG
jgi:hypothetical protein